MKKLVLFALFGCLSICQSWSQTQINNSSPRLYYFECADIDFNKYVELHESVKADGQFHIETACIPAHVLCVKALNTTAAADAFKQLALLSGIQQVALRPQFTAADFDQRCAAARTGN